MTNAKPMPTIIVCIDTTIASNIVLRYACYKAKRTGFSVQILAIIESSYRSLPFVSKLVGKEKRIKTEKHIKKIVDQVYEETGIMPCISMREGDIVSEIIDEISSNPNCVMLVLGKSHNSLSDNTVLPRISNQIGEKIKVPISIVPEDLSDEYFTKLV